MTHERAIYILKNTAWLGSVYDLAEVEKAIRILEDAEPRRGRWEEVEVMPEAYDIAGVKTWASRLRCSNCGFTTVAIEGGIAQYNYCPNCGAKMGGEE